MNAFSKDWQELMDHAEKYGDDDKMLAWDYSKYDVRMNSQVTRKVWDSFIHLAERGGYDEQSLRIMKHDCGYHTSFDGFEWYHAHGLCYEYFWQ